MQKLKNRPDVSVVMITWGHEKFIVQAIEGVLNQSFDGRIELLISNDCSPDDTNQVITSYLANHTIPPHIEIRYFNHEKNMGAMKNFIWTISKSEGDYIAICEGDDYWTDPKKMQKQVDYLRANPDCNLVYHRVMLWHEDGSLHEEDLNTATTSYKRTVEELAEKGNFMHTASVVFRNNIEFPENLKFSNVGDYPLWFLNGEVGKFGYLPDIMGVYRLWGGSIWGTKGLSYKGLNWLGVLSGLVNYTKDANLRKLLKTQAANVFTWISFQELDRKQKFRLIRYMFQLKPSLLAQMVGKAMGKK